ncbi:hypothetical protein PPYR_07328 [Photinus pyralis]|uniref:Peptide deformylase n=1 Tax=Photinus pyralis TaxID=7054 RepID=A0A1Y1KDG8_PHOPY|nr:peptide deformylase, mitochondrial-like isoform X1 [Photinus pyralis]XP_031333763.1 peptide deformylase, mitochondrial-like isoform X1 [Photinus pyralis]XP_031339221.1 peptide deformylase, mitochondrial-like isoform X1 [Photinus pyralis]KAB0799448.1 hypothetical protein PPYR_07328 [Photinus pyralis]
MNSKLPYTVSLNLYRKLSFGKFKSWYCGLVKKAPPIPPYSHIIQTGDPALRVVSEQVPNNLVHTPEIKFLMQRLKSVFERYGCVGLSACQIGIPLRIIIVEFNNNHMKQYSAEECKHKEIQVLPQTILVNPELRVLDYTKITHTEGCESVRGFIADVPRYRSVEIKGANENGEEIILNANGWISRIFQHELDHLNGKLYTDIMDRKTFSCSCWEIVNEKGGKVELPFSP